MGLFSIIPAEAPTFLFGKSKFRFTRTAIHVMLPSNSSHGKGRLAIVRVRGVRGSGRGRRWRQGGRRAGVSPVSDQRARDDGVAGVRQNRVVVTPGYPASSLAALRWSNRAAHPMTAARRRWQQGIVSPARARHKPFQPLRREGRAFGRTCFSPVSDYHALMHRGLAGASRCPVFPAPFRFEGCRDPARPGRNAPRDRETLPVPQ